MRFGCKEQSLSLRRLFIPASSQQMQLASRATVNLYSGVYVIYAISGMNIQGNHILSFGSYEVGLNYIGINGSTFSERKRRIRGHLKI